MAVSLLKTHVFTFQEIPTGGARVLPAVEVPAGTTCLLFGYSGRANSTQPQYIESIDCNGDTSAQRLTGSRAPGGSSTGEMWYLNAPPTGIYDITLAYNSEAVEDAIRVYCLGNTDPVNPIGAVALGPSHEQGPIVSATLEGDGSFIAVQSTIYFNRGPVINMPAGYVVDEDGNFGPFQAWTFAAHKMEAGLGGTVETFSGVWSNGSYYDVDIMVEVKAAPDTGTVVGKEVGVVWGVREVHANSREARWNVLSTIDRLLDARWAVRRLARGEATIPWDARGAVGEALTLGWDSRAAIESEASIAWAVRALTGGQANIRYDLRQAVADAAQARWDILNAFVVSVALELTWRLRQVASGQAAGLWALRNLAGSQNDARWGLRSLAGSQRGLTWRDLQLVADAVSAVWDMRQVAGSGAYLRWDGRALAALGIDAGWGIRGLAGDGLDFRWGVRNSLSGQAGLEWALRNLAGDGLGALWGLKAPVEADLDALWRVLSLVQGGLSLGRLKVVPILGGGLEVRPGLEARLRVKE